jgi:hypothetical protein
MRLRLDYGENSLGEVAAAVSHDLASTSAKAGE